MHKNAVIGYQPCFFLKIFMSLHTTLVETVDLDEPGVLQNEKGKATSCALRMQHEGGKKRQPNALTVEKAKEKQCRIY